MWCNRIIGCSKKKCKKKRRKVENKIGIFALSSEELSKLGKKGGSIGGPKGVRTQLENEIGIYWLSEEERSRNCKKGGKVTGDFIYKNKIGMFARTKTQISIDASKGGKVVGNQRWKCLVTGYISNAGALLRYQKARGIDTSQRVRVE